MRRWILALVFGCAALSAQEPAAQPPPARQFKPPQDWFRWNFTNEQPHSFTLAPRQEWFRRKLANVQPRNFTLAMAPEPRACVVPLLKAPIDPNIDWKMPLLKSPVENIDNMPVAKGLPPCASEHSQPGVWYFPHTQ